MPYEDAKTAYSGTLQMPQAIPSLATPPKDPSILDIFRMQSERIDRLEMELSSLREESRQAHTRLNAAARIVGRDF